MATGPAWLLNVSFVTINDPGVRATTNPNISLELKTSEKCVTLELLKEKYGSQFVMGVDPLPSFSSPADEESFFKNAVHPFGSITYQFSAGPAVGMSFGFQRQRCVKNAGIGYRR